MTSTSIYKHIQYISAINNQCDLTLVINTDKFNNIGKIK